MMKMIAGAKFICDTERCIDCGGCVIACRQGNKVPAEVNRRRVITLRQGEPGERSISVSCMHCADPLCMAVCPSDAIYRRHNGIVLVDRQRCIGCGYCFLACPLGAPQFLKGKVNGGRGVMDKCTFCGDGPVESLVIEGEHPCRQDGGAEGKVPFCAAMCATRALLAGDAGVIAAVYRERVRQRGANPDFS